MINQRSVDRATEKENGDLIVRRAQPQDIDIVQSILDEAAAWLQQRGINQWPSPFPRREIEQRFTDGLIYLAFSGRQPIGTFTLFTSDPETWGDQPPDALYLHGLALRRAYSGNELGRKLLFHAEQIARAWSKRWLRLDCWAGNEALDQFYRAAGFHDCGVVERPMGSDVWSCRLFQKDVA